MQSIIKAIAGAGFAALATLGIAQAAEITFVHEGSADGSIGGTPFFSFFTITAVGDTNNRESNANAFWINHDSAQIEIEGVGTFDFITLTRTFVNNSAETVGFSRAFGGSLDLFNGPEDDAFGAWDMTTSIGPISGGGQLVQWDLETVSTSGGVLVFDDAITDARFTATIVPVPAAAFLFAPALGGFMAWRRKQSA